MFLEKAIEALLTLTTADLPACQASPTALQGWMVLQLSRALLQCRNEL